nr:hypothetical protein [uncultured bacterium]
MMPKKSSLRRLQRGATVLEYALLVGFLVVPLVTVLDNLQEQQGSNVSEGGQRIGTPVVGAGYTVTGNNGNAGTAGSSGTPPTATVSVEITFSAPSVTGNGNNKNVTQSFTIKDTATATVQGGAEVTGQWYHADGVTALGTPTSCVIESNNLCSVTVSGVKASQVGNALVFKITNIDPPELVPSGATSLQTTIPI